MNKKLLIILILLFGFLGLIAVVFLNNSSSVLVSPGMEKPVVGQASSEPAASSYNPPKEIRYGSTTDLKQELESINPEVSDSDFAE